MTMEIDEDIFSAQPDEYVPVGLDGLLGATQKVLGMNRGLLEEDHRDGMAFKRLMTPADLMAERVRMDTGGVMRKLMSHAARRRNLRGMQVAALTPLVEGHLVGNSMSSPLEQINPMDEVNQARRITLMGPGGIGSDDSITPAMQALQTSSFGFLSAIEGPESHIRDTDVFTKEGWIPWTEVNDTTLFACRVENRLEFHRASKINIHRFTGELMGVRSQDFDFLVTPKHRMLYRPYEDTAAIKQGANPLEVAFIKDLYGSRIKFPCDHLPYTGKEAVHDYPDTKISTADFCEFLAWWLAEGNINANSVIVTKTDYYKTSDHQYLKQWLPTIGFGTNWKPNEKRTDVIGFRLLNAQLSEYLARFGKSGTKYIPEWVFDTSIEVRQRMLDVFMRTDARINATHRTYCSTSKRLALDVQRLMISLGHPTNFREEKDRRDHVKSTNWCACQLKTKVRVAKSSPKYDYWVTQPYDDLVYCATVPGGFLYTKRGRGVGFWSGNSEKAGIDTRMSNGVRIGSNGRLYQKFRNPKTKAMHWMSPEDLHGKVIGLPNA